MTQDVFDSDEPEVFERQTIEVMPTAALIDLFAALTGDVSSLHMDDAFARRSAYRQRVVHGMLPLAFLPMLPALRRPGRRCVIVAMSGRFSEPLFADTLVTISLESREQRSAPGLTTFDYRVQADGAVSPATSGSITVRYEEGEGLPASAASSTGLVTGALEVRDFRFEDIERGMHEDPIDFAVVDGVVEGYRALLRGGVHHPIEPEGVECTFALPGLFAVLLLSTSVGVSLPGANATFIDFQVDDVGDLPAGPVCRLSGSVRRASRATRIVKKDLAVTARDSIGEEPLMHARVSTLVNEPAVVMPSVAELREAMDTGLARRTVLVTGASRGIGETIAKLFALHGARVVVNFHRGEVDAERVVREIVDAGGEAIAVGADVSDQAAVRRMIDVAVDHFGAVDVLVNNAAKDFRPIPFDRLTWDDVQGDLDVIVKGALNCCQATIPAMAERGWGRVINLGSVATENPAPDQLKYIVAKSALVGLTRSLAVEFGPRNVLVNLVVPNFVQTDLVSHIQEGFRRQIAESIPLQRLAEPTEIAQTVVYLASSSAGYVTGQKLMVTGGSAPLL